jgi:hypothetical protein
MVVDPSLDKLKNTPIPQYKIDSSNDVSRCSNFEKVFTQVKNSKKL